MGTGAGGGDGYLRGCCRGQPAPATLAVPVAPGGAAPAAAASRGCYCCGTPCECPEGFRKVLELKDVGLIVYRHTVRTEEVSTYPKID